jgi:MYXO-CTERM domain-containing protein
LSPNGIEYGLVNALFIGGANGGPNGPLNGPNALLTCSVTYTFYGFADFDEGDIRNVMFNYGTDFSPIPAPGAALLGVIGLGTIAWIRRRSS